MLCKGNLEVHTGPSHTEIKLGKTEEDIAIMYG
jgi:hypothetical protein